ncbi:hypothetical protein [Myxococcus xanthus]
MISHFENLEGGGDYRTRSMRCFAPLDAPLAQSLKGHLRDALGDRDEGVAVVEFDLAHVRRGQPTRLARTALEAALPYVRAFWLPKYTSETLHWIESFWDHLLGKSFD